MENNLLPISSLTELFNRSKSNAWADLLVQTALSLFEAPLDQTSRLVCKSLDSLAVTMGVERTHLALFHESDEQLTWLSEGSAPHIPPLNIHFRSFDTRQYAWLISKLRRGEPFHFSDLDSSEIAPERPEYDLFLKTGYLATLFVPLLVEGKLVGWIGLGTRQRPFPWKLEDVPFVQALGSYLYTAIDKYKTSKAQLAMARGLMEAQRLARMGSWEYHFPSGKMRWSEQLFDILELDPVATKPSLRTILKKLDKEEALRLLNCLKNLEDFGGSKNLDFRLTMPDGRTKYVSCKAILHISKKGNPLKLTGYVQDMTIWKEAEQRQKETSKKLELIFHKIHDFVVLFKVDEQGIVRFDSLNDSFLHFHKNYWGDHLEAEDFIGLELSSYFKDYLQASESAIRESMERVKHVIQTLTPVQYPEYGVVGGKSIFLESRLVPLVEGNRCAYLLWTSHDVTKLKTAEQALQERERQYQLALEAADLGFFRSSLGEGTIEIDARYSQMLGFDPEPRTLSIEELSAMLLPENLEENRRLFEKIKTATNPSVSFNMDMVVNTKRGIRHLSSAAHLLFDSGNKPKVLLGFVKDVTVEKMAAMRLQESEERWRTLHEGASDAIVVVENDVFVDCNQAAVRVFGCKRKEDILGKTPWDFSPALQPDGTPSREIGLRFIQRSMEGEQPTFTWIHRKANGEPFHAEVSLSCIKVQGKTLVQGIVRDVSERMKMLQALKDSEEKYRTLLASSLQGIMILQDEKVQFVNSTMAELLGYTKELLQRRTLDELLERVVEQDRPDLLALKTANLANPIMLEFRYRWSPFKLRWLRCRFSWIQFAGRRSMLITALDITDQKKAREFYVSSATESEDRARTQIATELHDSLGQLLSSAYLNLGALKEPAVKLDEQARRNYQLAVESLKAAIEETRSIAHNLMPKAIKDFGYPMAVAQLITSMNEQGQVTYRFLTNFKEGRLSPMVERNLYRITQEALNNIQRHAHATEATVQLMKYPDSVVLSIEDDGVGFDLQNVNMEAHMGLRNILARAKAIGARADIESRLGAGTTIIVEIPFSHE